MMIIRVILLRVSHKEAPSGTDFCFPSVDSPRENIIEKHEQATEKPTQVGVCGKRSGQTYLQKQWRRTAPLGSGLWSRGRGLCVQPAKSYAVGPTKCTRWHQALCCGGSAQLSAAAAATTMRTPPTQLPLPDEPPGNESR